MVALAALALALVLLASFVLFFPFTLLVVVFTHDRWSHRSESNRQPAVYKTAAPPLCYCGKSFLLGIPTLLGVGDGKGLLLGLPSHEFFLQVVSEGFF